MIRLLREVPLAGLVVVVGGVVVLNGVGLVPVRVLVVVDASSFVEVVVGRVALLVIRRVRVEHIVVVVMVAVVLPFVLVLEMVRLTRVLVLGRLVLNRLGLVVSDGLVDERLVLMDGGMSLLGTVLLGIAVLVVMDRALLVVMNRDVTMAFRRALCSRFRIRESSPLLGLFLLGGSCLASGLRSLRHRELGPGRLGLGLLGLSLVLGSGLLEAGLAFLLLLFVLPALGLGFLARLPERALLLLPPELLLLLLPFPLVFFILGLEDGLDGFSLLTGLQVGLGRVRVLQLVGRELPFVFLLLDLLLGLTLLLLLVEFPLLFFFNRGEPGLHRGQGRLELLLAKRLRSPRLRSPRMLELLVIGTNGRRGLRMLELLVIGYRGSRLLRDEREGRGRLLGGLFLLF